METPPDLNQKNYPSKSQINIPKSSNDLGQPLKSKSPHKPNKLLIPILVISTVLSLGIASYFAYQNNLLKQALQSQSGQASSEQLIDEQVSIQNFPALEFNSTSTANLPLLPLTVAIDFSCSSFEQGSEPPCQVIESRVRDLFQTTRNTRNLLIEVKNKQIDQLNSPLNKVNNLKNELTSLWLKIAGYGLGTDPFVNQHIFFSSSGFSEAKPSSSYGLSSDYIQIGIPRLYDQFLANSKLSEQEIKYIRQLNGI